MGVRLIGQGGGERLADGRVVGLSSNAAHVKSARDAFRSYLMASASHAHKDTFNVPELDLQARPEELAPDAEEAAEAARLDARAALEKLLGRAQRGALRGER